MSNIVILVGRMRRGSNTENRQIDEQLRRAQQPVYDLTGIFT